MKRYTIEFLSPCIAVLLSKTNLGILFDTSSPDFVNVYFVDSGGSAKDGQILMEEAEKICKEKFNRKIKIQAIFNTHSHADHSGGNHFLQEQTNCKVYSTEKEIAGIQNQSLESSIIWGSYPIPELCTEFYLAENSRVTDVIHPEQEINLGNLNLKVISLPGHYFDPVGFIVKDKTSETTVLFLGDAIFGRKYMSKNWIPYIYDIAQFKQALIKISKIKADYYLPCHGDLSSEIEAVAELNMLALTETEHAIVKMLSVPKSEEEILKSVADINNLNMGVAQTVLIASTIRSFLTSLYRENKIEPLVQENRLFWKAKKL